MAAPKGNSFWKLRSKHGRDKLFASPELLLEAAYEYFEWCDKHPWTKSELVKSGDLAGQVLKVPTARPYTLSGLCIYLDASESYWRKFKKTENLPQDFFTVITHIEEIVDTQQFEGAAVGAFNSNIIARKLGLADKVDGNNINRNYNSDPLTPEKIREINSALENDY